MTTKAAEVAKLLRAELMLWGAATFALLLAAHHVSSMDRTYGRLVVAIQWVTAIALSSISLLAARKATHVRRVRQYVVSLQNFTPSRKGGGSVTGEDTHGESEDRD